MLKPILYCGLVSLTSLGLVSTIFPSASVAQEETLLNNIAVELSTLNNAFSTLDQALKAAMVNYKVLDERGPYTIFAPTNEAFAQLPPGTLNSLLAPENRAQLTEILRYHIIPAEIDTLSLEPGDVIQRETLAGQTLTIRMLNNYEVTVNGVKVTTSDIPVTNGVIHTINQVLIP
jgi:uncharacterized surface protein with fasciclin (FAS1) repeats